MTSGLPEPLRRLHRQHVQAWCDLDLDRLEELYDRAVLVFDTYPPPVYRGWNEFRDRIAGELARFDRFDLRTFDRIGGRHGEIGWVASRYRIDAVQDGAPYTAAGRWTEVYAERKNGWKLIHFHSSIDPEP